jgi:hypothetical protein
MNIFELLCVGLIIFWVGTQVEKSRAIDAAQEDFNLGFDYAMKQCGENDQP